MKRLFSGLVFLSCFVAGLILGFSEVACTAVSGKSFSIVYSSDERGAITPCG